MVLMDISFDSKVLNRSVPMKAVLPLDGAATATKPLKALYLLHGLNGSERDYLTFTRVALWARERGLALFFPAGENSFYVKKHATGEDYMRYIGQEIPDLTRRMFPLSPLRQDTFIGGLSMGGYGALNAGLLYPDTFGKVIAFSAALRPWQRELMPTSAYSVWRQELMRTLFGNAPEQWDTLSLAKSCRGPMPQIWMTCGTEDSLLPLNRQFARDMTALGIPLHYEERTGAHNWNFWNDNLPDALDFLMHT